MKGVILIAVVCVRDSVKQIIVFVHEDVTPMPPK
jgi:hypothetical protein